MCDHDKNRMQVVCDEDVCAQCYEDALMSEPVRPRKPMPIEQAKGAAWELYIFENHGRNNDRPAFDPESWKQYTRLR